MSERCEWAYAPFNRNAAGPAGDAMRSDANGRLVGPAGRVYCAPAGKLEAAPRRGNPAVRITRLEAVRAIGRQGVDEMRNDALTWNAMVGEDGHPVRPAAE